MKGLREMLSYAAISHRVRKFPPPSMCEQVQADTFSRKRTHLVAYSFSWVPTVFAVKMVNYAKEELKCRGGAQKKQTNAPKRRCEIRHYYPFSVEVCSDELSHARNNILQHLPLINEAGSPLTPLMSLFILGDRSKKRTSVREKER